MNNKKKYIFIVIISIFVLITLGCRYAKINKDVPNAYEKQSYDINQNIDLDNLQLVVKSYSIDKTGDNNYNNTDVSLELEIKNKSDTTIDGTALIYNSKLATGFSYQDCANIEDNDLQNLKNLKAKDELKFSINYSLAPEQLENIESLKFYISNILYKDEIIEKYKDLIFYSKYIELNLN